jgi:polysaccharide biosynthesis/export protein
MKKSIVLAVILLAAIFVASSSGQEYGPAAPGGVFSPAGLSPGAPTLAPEAIQSLTPQTIQHLPPEIQSQIPAALKGQLSETGYAEQATPDKAAADLHPEAVFSRRSSNSLSKIESRYRSGYGSALAEDLRQFGYQLFASTIPKPSRLAVPGKDYILGPGDKMRIRVWGTEVDAEFTGSIDRNGTINVPRIGIVPVAGVKFGQVEAVIRREAEKYLQGININVSMEELRSLEVYIVGSVQQPGLHLVPAFSTVLDGLLASGGVRNSGSLRSVGLYRDGKLLREIDLYELLLQGDRSFDTIIENRDVIFVPRLNRTAAVTGAVKEEGIFELNREKSIGDLMQLAGGIIPQGFTGRIYLRRYTQNEEFIIQDIDTGRDKDWQDIPIQDGDLLELQFLSSAMPSVVRLDGHVWNPDVFRFQPGLSLRDVLAGREILRPGAVMDFALLHRYDPVTTRFTVRRFPLAQVFLGQFEMALQPRDRIEILSREEIGIREEITVQGAVWKPGDFIHRPDLTLDDAIALAGGEQFGARVQQIELSRQSIEDGQAITTHFYLDLAANADFPLQPFDYILVPRVKDAKALKTIVISGEVKYPGTYRIAGGERVSDLILRAGGFLPEAYFFGARYTSEKARVIQQRSIDNLIQELEIRSQQALSQEAQTAVSREAVEAAEIARTSLRTLLQKMSSVKAEGRVAIRLADLQSFRGSAFDFVLEEGDVLHVPKQPNFVATVGSLYSPSAYLYEPNRTVAHYLKKSGGPTKTADKKHIYVLKANGEVISKEQGGSLFASFESQKLMPGDTIVVPENLERVPYLRLVKDVTDIVFKIATTAGIALAVL